MTASGRLAALKPDAAPASPERRAEQRVTLFIRTAKLIAGDDEYLCIIRDVSHAGIKLRLFNAIPVCEDMQLEVGSGERFPIEPVWAEDDYAGFRFADEADLDRLLELPDGKFRKRSVRLRAEVEARIGWGDESHDVVFENLSQQGGCIRCEVPLAIDQLIRVECPGLSRFYAKVRWRKEANYGLVFEYTLKLEDLAKLATPLNSDDGQDPD